MKTKHKKKGNPVEFVSVHQARADLPKIVKASQDTPHVVLRHGKPVAVMLGVEGKDIVAVVRERFKLAKAGKMEFVAMRKARAGFSGLLDDVQKTPHAILNFGNPTAVVVGVDGREISDLLAEFGAAA